MQTSERDISYFKDPNKWPGIVLPIKRPNPKAEWGTELACLSATIRPPWNLHIAHSNLYQLWGAKWEPITVEQLIEEGWVVD